MNIKPLRTEQDYQEALIEFDRIKEFPLDSKEGQKAEILSVLIEDYKSKYYPEIEPTTDWSIDYLYSLVQNVVKLENKGTLSDKGLKLCEEVGELAAELLKFSGYKHSNDTPEQYTQKALLESVDCMIMIFHIMIDLGFTKQQIVEMCESQINKWLTYVS